MSKPKLAVIVDGDLAAAGSGDEGNIDGLGTAATKDVGTTEGDVLLVQKGTTFAAGQDDGAWPTPTTVAENISLFGRSDVAQDGIPAYASAVQFSGGSDTWSRLSASHDTAKAWIQGGYIPETGDATKWTSELLTTANILTTTGDSAQYPMSQKAVTDALAAVVTTNNWYLGTDKVQTNTDTTGATDLNLADASTFDLTLTGNVTLSVSNDTVPAGYTRSIVVRIRQGTTARTVTWWDGITWLAPSTPMAPGADKVTEYVLTYNGSGWIGRVGASN